MHQIRYEKRVNIDHVRLAINEFAWEGHLLIRIKIKKILFNKTLMNIISCYIPHETIFLMIAISKDE